MVGFRHRSSRLSSPSALNLDQSSRGMLSDCGSVGLLARISDAPVRFSEDWRSLVPLIPLSALLVAIVEQCSHVALIKTLPPFCREVRTDIGQIVIDAVAFRRGINPHSIVVAAVVDHRGDGPPGDAEETSIDLSPFGSSRAFRIT